MKPPRAVLFDFDGVLADTENVHVAAWERTFGYMGWDVPPETCARAAEIDDRLFLRDVFAARGIHDGDIAGWVRHKQAVALPMLAEHPRLYPGAAALVRALEGRARLAVVTGTWRENVQTVLRAAGLLDRFALVVAKEDADAPKPHPAAYRLALKRLRLVPESVVALEDSPGGLAAAVGAGVRAVAVGHRREEGPWTDGAPFLASLADPAALPILGFPGSPAPPGPAPA